jgi:hypothetical protein
VSSIDQSNQHYLMKVAAKKIRQRGCYLNWFPQYAC